MTTEKWLDIWGNKIIRQYVIDMCKAFTRDLDLQEDLMQEAWLRIGQCEDGKATAYYIDQAFKGMDVFYHREWRERRLSRKGKDYKHNRDAVRKRTRRAEKKFRENVQKSALTRHSRVDEQ